MIQHRTPYPFTTLDERAQRDDDYFAACWDVAYRNQGRFTECLDQILELTCERFQAWAASVRIHDRAHRCLSFCGIVAAEGWDDAWTLRRIQRNDDSVGGRVLRTKRPLCYNDVLGTQPKYEFFSPRTKAMCSVPLLFRDDLQGVLSLDSEQVDVFDIHTIDLLTRTAELLVFVYESNNALQERQLRADMLDVLGRDRLDPPLLDFVLLVRTALQCASCSVALRGNDPRDPYLLAATTDEASRSLVGKRQYRPEVGRLGWVLRENRPVRLPAHITTADAQAIYGPQLTFAETTTECAQHESFMAVPVGVTSSAPQAILWVTQPYRGRAQDLFAPAHQHLLEAAAQQLADALDRKQLALGQQAAARGVQARNVARQVSHALTNPAFGLSARLEQLRRRLQPPTEVEPILQRMETLIREIQDVERDFRVLMDLTQPQLHPTDVVALACMVFAEMLRETPLELHLVRPSTAWPMLLVDRSLTRIVFESLADNIRQIIKRPGLVEVQFTGPHEPRTAPIAAMAIPYFLVTIIDQGPGIPPHEKEKIFTDGYSKRMQGTGIGLFSARARMHLQKGMILEDGPGTAAIGARFRLAFAAPVEGQP